MIGTEVISEFLINSEETKMVGNIMKCIHIDNIIV